MAERPMPAVKALIEEDGRFLALKMDLEEEGVLWTLPGGRIEHGESPEDALHREVQEEVSLDISIEEPEGMFHFFFGDSDENQVILTVFRCRSEGGEVDIGSNPSEEEAERIVGYEWVEPDEFLERPAEETLKEVIRDKYGSELPKLVRDRIPGIIREDGDEPVTTRVSGEELEEYLGDKLVEEAEEFRESGELEELADVLEVVRRVLDLEEEDWEVLEELREVKKEERGGFDENIVLRDMED